MFDLFSIGIGPSSSHTVGPMRAARMFVTGLDEATLNRVDRVTAELFGSLGATGHGHGSYNAVLWGLEGEDPETVDTKLGPLRATEVCESGRLLLAGRRQIAFNHDADLVLYRRKALPYHPNGMIFTAYAGTGEGATKIAERTYYSIGGGFVVGSDEEGHPVVVPDPTAVPYPFATGKDLLQRCRDIGGGISDVMLANECARRPEAEVRAGLLKIWAVMVECVRNGCATTGTLPGGLKVRRRAAELNTRLIAGRRPVPRTRSIRCRRWTG